MKRLYTLFLMMGFLILLSACSNEQIQDAIDDCQNDPECQSIVDDAIEEELSSRGISGGLMTIQELEDVYNLLEQAYVPDNELYTMELYSLLYLYVDASLYHNLNNRDQVDLVTYSLQSIFNRDETLNELLNLRDINTENKQYFIVDEVKYILFKTGANSFQYEVYGDQLYTFTIDTEINRIYLGDTLLETDVTIIEDILNGEYMFTNTTIFRQENIVYYHFEYDGYNVGAFDLDTLERYEMTFYEDRFDMVEYTGTTPNRTQISSISFTGTISEFFTEISTTSVTALEDYQPFVTAITSYYENIQITHQIDYNN